MENSKNETTVIYSPKRVAEILEVKESFVKRLLREGTLKGFKIGKFWRILKSNLDKYCSACSENGNGKRRLSDSTRDKIRFHASIKSHDSLPDAVDEIAEKIRKIKGELDRQNGFRKIASIDKLKSAVMLREEKRQKMEDMPALLEELAEKAYPDAKALADERPDVIEEVLQEKAGRGPKTMVELLHNSVPEEVLKEIAEQPEEEAFEVKRAEPE